MAEPQMWEGSIILSVIVLNIPVILYAAIRYYDDGGGVG